MAVKPRDPQDRVPRELEDRLRELKEAVRELEESMHAVVAQSEPATVFAETLHDLLGDQELPAHAARRAALGAASSVVWADAVGPLLTVGQARELTGVSRQRLNQIIHQGRLIALTDKSRNRLLPAWQFDEHGHVLSALADAHQRLVHDGHLSEWTAASWCSHPHQELDGLTPRAWAADRKEPERLQLVATRDAARAAQ